jgi:hypothetical protein
MAFCYTSLRRDGMRNWSRGKKRRSEYLSVLLQVCHESADCLERVAGSCTGNSAWGYRMRDRCGGWVKLSKSECGWPNDRDCAADSVGAMGCFYCAMTFCHSRGEHSAVPGISNLGSLALWG